MSNQRLEQLRQFLEQSPEDSFLRYALAKEHEKLGQQQEALTNYQQLLSDDPAYVGAYYHLGKLLVKLEQYDEAMTAYQQGIEQAGKARDQHAKGELMGAKMELEDLMEDLE
ncbi:MAG: tetratricopeptide repeat protein [Bacteroidota bacterium]